MHASVKTSLDRLFFHQVVDNDAACVHSAMQGDRTGTHWVLEQPLVTAGTSAVRLAPKVPARASATFRARRLLVQRQLLQRPQPRLRVSARLLLGALAQPQTLVSWWVLHSTCYVIWYYPRQMA